MPSRLSDLDGDQDSRGGGQAGPSPRNQQAKRVFTEYVRALEAYGEPDREQILPVWRALGASLIREIKRRGLWQAPPRQLGVFGWPNWGARADRAEIAPRDWPSFPGAIEELLAECFAFVFVLRLRSLRLHLASKDNIDGLVFLNIRHFLHDRQRKYDPLGYKVFCAVHRSVQRAVDIGLIQLREAGQAVRSDSFLVGAEAGATEAWQGVDRARAAADRLVEGLLPGLIIGPRPERFQGETVMVERLGRLASSGGLDFRVRDLVAALRRLARASWTSAYRASLEPLAVQGEERADGRFASLVRVCRPDIRFVERDTFWQVVRQVEERLRALQVDDRTRDYLEKLWAFLVIHAAEGDSEAGSAASADGPEGLAPTPSGSDKPPSRRRIAAVLGIPRARLPELYDRIGTMFLERSRGGIP